MPPDPKTQQIARTERDRFLGPSPSEKAARSEQLRSILSRAEFSPEQMRIVQDFLGTLRVDVSPADAARNETYFGELRRERLRLLELGALPRLDLRDFELLQLLGANILSERHGTVAQTVLSTAEKCQLPAEVQAQLRPGPTLDPAIESECAQVVSLLRQQGADTFALQEPGQPTRLYFVPRETPPIKRERLVPVDWRVAEEPREIRISHEGFGMVIEVPVPPIGTPRRRRRWPPQT